MFYQSSNQGWQCEEPSNSTGISLYFQQKYSGFKSSIPQLSNLKKKIYIYIYIKDDSFWNFAPSYLKDIAIKEDSL